MKYKYQCNECQEEILHKCSWEDKPRWIKCSCGGRAEPVIRNVLIDTGFDGSYNKEYGGKSG